VDPACQVGANGARPSDPVDGRDDSGAQHRRHDVDAFHARCHGNYANGTWSTAIPQDLTRTAFASNVMPNGKVFVLGGEHSGTALVGNWTGYGDIYDPVANTWTTLRPTRLSQLRISRSLRGQHDCRFPTVTGMDPPSTAGFQVGWSVAGSGIPANTTILSVDSTSQITLSNSATSTGNFQLTITTPMLEIRRRARELSAAYRTRPVIKSAGQ